VRIFPPLLFAWLKRQPLNNNDETAAAAAAAQKELLCNVGFLLGREISAFNAAPCFLRGTLLFSLIRRCYSWRAPRLPMFAVTRPPPPLTNTLPRIMSSPSH
jgi:hypothetical protein